MDPNDMTKEELIRVTQRDRWVKAQMAERIASLVQENLGFLAIIQELQQDLADVRQSEALLFAANTSDVAADQPQLFAQE